MQITLPTNTGEINAVRTQLRFFLSFVASSSIRCYKYSRFFFVLAISISFSDFTAFYILMT